MAATGQGPALDAEGERLRSLADAMPQLVWIADETGTVVYYNSRQREYAGIVESGGVYRWEPVVHPEDLPATELAWSTALAQGTPYVCEHRVRMADGSFRWHLSRANPVRDARGVVVWYGTATDVHQQKCAEADLADALATRDQIAAMVAHDLRNPLSVVRLAIPSLTNVLDELPGPARAQAESTLARLDRQVVRMQKLLDELVDVAALRSGQQLVLQRAPADLSEIVRDVIADHEELTRGRHPVLLRDAGEPLRGEWDAERLHRVLANLLSNAAKYSPPRSSITIELARDGEWVSVSVGDAGIGIRDEDRERIFEWYARGDNTGGRVPGTGIGLAGARAIAVQHGGTLEVESTLGAGSTFTLRLPSSLTS